MTEPVVTTTMLTGPEKAAWEVAVTRGLPIEAGDLRALLEAAGPLTVEERIRPLIVSWRHAAASLAESHATWSSHLYECASELERVLDGAP